MALCLPNPIWWCLAVLENGGGFGSLLRDRPKITFAPKMWNYGVWQLGQKRGVADRPDFWKHDCCGLSDEATYVIK